jgi:hypothetical protein
LNEKLPPELIKKTYLWIAIGANNGKGIRLMTLGKSGY